jgi:diacylglycerol kinase family enzyme
MPAPGEGWVGIIANRNSGRGAGLQLVRRLTRALRRRSLHESIAWTLEERSALIRRSTNDPLCRCLVAVGGDGTVAAIVNEHPAVPLTVLPAGTENLVAQHFGFRRNPERLAEIIATGHPIRVDLGLAGDRRFFAMAGFGFDGDVVTRHHRSRISRTGQIRRTTRIAYVEPILRASFAYPFPKISVQILDPGAEETVTGTTVFVFNLPRYAMRLPFAPQAREDDGWLDLVVFRNPGPFQALYYLWKVLRQRHFDQPGVYHRRVRKVVVTADQPVPVQLDGDPGGYVLPAGALDTGGTGSGGQRAVEWTIQIVPAAIEMFVSPHRRHVAARVPLAANRTRR